jgi:ABC-type multidrug transport system fused ATPase/permease subunit
VSQPLLRYIIAQGIRKTMIEIRKKIFIQIEQLPVSYHEKHHSGDVMSRFYRDVDMIGGLFSDQIYFLIYTVVLGVGSLILIFNLNLTLAVVTIIIGLIATWINTTFAKTFKVLNHQIQYRWGRVTERLVDLILGRTVVKTFHLENTITQQYIDAQDNVTKPVTKSAIIGVNLGLINDTLDLIKSIGLISVAAFLVIQKKADVGSCAAAFYIQGSLYYMFNNIGSFINGSQSALAGAKRLFEFLDMPVESPSSQLPLESANNSIIEMHDVSFSYSADKAVLHNLNFTIIEGQTAALVGYSGSGKSTIFKLLLGFYPIESGNIFIYGKSIGEYSLTQLRDLIAYVPQDTYLFDGTIEDNIRYGRPNATKNEVIFAAREANAHDFILEQIHGYNTIVGENGCKLSEGQKQRIAIARAFLKDSPILLLDEATSALDSKSERQVQEAIHRLMNKRSVLVIAHRLSTIKNANIIYVINNGTVAEKGNHQQLLINGGLYKSFYEAQFQS